MGKPVALDARAEEREVRGLISITTTRPVSGSWANWTFVPPITSMASTMSYEYFWSRSWAPGRWSAWGRAERIPGVDPHGVDVLDETDGDLLPLGVPDDFQLEFLP